MLQIFQRETRVRISLYKKAFQSNAIWPLPDSLFFKVNTFDRVWGSRAEVLYGGGGCPGPLWWEPLYRTEPMTDRQTYLKQECIPVGCVPAARWLYAGVCFRGGMQKIKSEKKSKGVSGPGGVCLLWGGYLVLGGLVPGGCLVSRGGCLVPRGGCLVRGVSALGGVWSQGCLVSGVSGLGGVWSQGVCVSGPGGGVSSGAGCKHYPPATSLTRGNKSNQSIHYMVWLRVKNWVRIIPKK